MAKISIGGAKKASASYQRGNISVKAGNVEEMAVAAVAVKKKNASAESAGSSMAQRRSKRRRQWRPSAASALYQWWRIIKRKSNVSKRAA